MFRGFTLLGRIASSYARSGYTIALMVVCLLATIGRPASALAQGTVADPKACYALADNGGGNVEDVLTRIDRATGTIIDVIGPTGTFDAESMAFTPGGAVVYVVDHNQLGSLDLNTAAFTPIGSPLGPANGALGTVSIAGINVDGLSYDAVDNILYGSVRRNQTHDLLIKIDPTSGTLIPFSPGIDYLVITESGSPNDYQDVDDLAFDPVTNALYGIANTKGGPGDLVIIDKATGTATFVAHFTIPDMEALTFFNDGELYAATGDNAGANSNSFYRIDKTTTTPVFIGSLGASGYSDFEGFGCLTAQVFVAVEKMTNGIDADLPPGPAVPVGNPVTWSYVIRNTGVVPVDNIVLADDQLAAGAISCPSFPQPNNGLNPNEEITCSASGIAIAGQYANTALVTGEGRPSIHSTVPLSDTDLSHYVGVQPDLVIHKDDGGVGTVPGGTVIYTLSFSNTGSAEATGVVLTEVIPANTTFNPASSSAGWTCAPDNSAGSVCTLSRSAVAVSQQGTVNFAVTVNPSMPAGVNMIFNQAQISDDGAHGPDATPTNNQDSDETPVTARPEPDGDKVADWADTGNLGGIDPGELITYTVIVRNIGNQELVNVPMVDNPDANSTLVAGTVTLIGGTGTVLAGNNPGDTTVSVTIDSIAGASEVKVTYQVRVNNPLPVGVDKIVNRALVTNTIPLSTTVPPAPVPDLVITKDDGGAQTTAGATVVYTLAYANAGDLSATGVVIRETVPANTTFNAALSTPGWSCPDGAPAGTACALMIGTLPRNLPGFVLFAVTVDDAVPAGVTQLDNVARIGDDGRNGDDPTPENNVDADNTPVAAAPDLVISKDDGNITVQPDGIATYTLVYANGGNQDATGVIITETVPANTTFAPASSTGGWLCTPDQSAGSTCTIDIGSVDAGATGSLTFAVLVDPVLPAGVTQLDNVARIGDDGRNGSDPATTNNQATDQTPVTAAPDLVIAKDDGDIGTTTGGLVIYTLDYHNVGNQGATGIVLTEQVPANTTYNATASAPTLWSCADGSPAGTICTASGAALAAGGSGIAHFAVNVNNSLPAGAKAIENVASIADDSSNGADLNPQDNQATDFTPVDAAPDLSIAKSDGGVTTQPGSTLVYLLNYHNTGNVGTTGVTIHETVPAHTTFNAAASAPALWSCADGSPAGTVCTFSINNLRAGAGGSARFALTVDNPLPASVTQIENLARIADDGGNGVDPTPQDNQAADVTPVDAVPDLRIAKSDKGVRGAAGGVVVYTLDYANAGTIGATNVVIQETVPPHTRFNAAASAPTVWNCADDSPAGTICTVSLSAVAGQSAGTLNFGVTVATPLPAGVDLTSNTARISDDGANGQDPNPANNSATDDTPLDAVPELVIQIHPDVADVLPGEPIQYTLVYTNIGNQDATGVVIRELLPEWTTFDATNSSPGWSCAPDSASGRTICTFQVGAVAAGQANAASQVPARMTARSSAVMPIFAVVVAAQVPQTVDVIVNQATINDDGTNGIAPGTPHGDRVATPLGHPLALDPTDEPVAVPVRIFLPVITR